MVSYLVAHGADETSLTQEQQNQFKSRIDEGIKIRDILEKVEEGDVCPISHNELTKDGTMSGEKVYSTGGQHVYTESYIKDWLRVNNGTARDPMTKRLFGESDLIDLTDHIKVYFTAREARKLSSPIEQNGAAVTQITALNEFNLETEEEKIEGFSRSITRSSRSRTRSRRTRFIIGIN